MTRAILAENAPHAVAFRALWGQLGLLFFGEAVEEGGGSGLYGLEGSEMRGFEGDAVLQHYGKFRTLGSWAGAQAVGGRLEGLGRRQRIGLEGVE